ncbi:ABC transporter permease subunit [Streptomyces physcomitrii]|uniref:ABC transporter permease subunit n=1 Tax=Streptomyces physcomitrii TaxID=2724184 RepID=UPI0008632870|nr:ABC transporter permease [Streptomyces albus]
MSTVAPPRRPVVDLAPPARGPRALLRPRPVRKLALLALLAAVLVPVAALTWSGAQWPADLTVDVSGPLGDTTDWIIDNRDSHPLFVYFLGHLSNAVVLSVRGVYLLLLALGWIGVTAGGTLLAWRLAGARIAALTLVFFLVSGGLGMWVPTMQTLALMVVAVFVSALVGALLGLAAGLSERTFRLLRPVLDTMQVLPAFAYLLPVALVFGNGVPAALLATVIYAAPPMARLTALGLRGADATVIEAVSSLGATGRQKLLTARLPLARKELLLGLNQTIMMALSMVVIASMIGAAGLGDRVYQALSTVDVGAALAAALPIVLLAIVMDRTTAAAGERLGAGGAPPGPGALRGPLLWAALAAVTTVLAVAGRLSGSRVWPTGWTLEIARPVNDFKEWMVDHLYSGVPVVGGTADWAGRFTDWVLNPLRDGLTALPWYGTLLVVAALAWLIGTWRTALTAVLAMAAIGVLGVWEPSMNTLSQVLAALAWLIGTWRTALTAVLAMAAIGVLGVWEPSMNTLSQVLAALAVTLVLGFAVGVFAAGSRRFEALLRPVLDVLQTMPQFVYLIPVVALFAVGRAPAVAAAVVYALPAVIRITTQGLRQVDPAAVEAARSLGATRWQTLRQVQLPLARPALLLAVNQGVVLVLAVVVIGGLVGGGALGYDVVTGLATGDLALGLVAGVAIVCLGLVLDRVTQPTERRSTGKGA